MENLKKEIMVGLVISLGGTAYLSVDNKVIGALLFAVGLLLVCCREYRLYTGKIPYIKPRPEELPGYVRMLLVNLFVAMCMGFVFRMARPDLIGKATELCANKFSEGWRVIPRGALCNVFIYFAVDCMKRKRDAIHAIILILCVMGFILTGTEHCIANAFYIGAANTKVSMALPYLGLNIIGNTLGGILIYRIDRMGVITHGEGQTC